MSSNPLQLVSGETGQDVPASSEAALHSPVEERDVTIVPLETRCAIATLDKRGMPVSVNAAFARLFAVDDGTGPKRDQPRLPAGVTLIESALRRYGESAMALAGCLRGDAAFKVVLHAAGDAESITLQGTACEDGSRIVVVDQVDAPVVDTSATTKADLAARRAETHVDQLTGLGNRRLLDELIVELGEENDAGKPTALMLIDLDRFKQVNDTLGHAAGDRLLSLVAKRFRRATRDEDILVRLGGDEFVVVLRGNDVLSTAEATAQRLIELTSRPFLVDGQQINIGASVGVAVLDTRRTSLVDLVRHADLALYEAKQAGRGQHRVFAPELETRAMERRDMELSLRRALGLREFELVYQPQVEVPGGKVLGFEALIRWNHPDRGVVSPNDFIPLAEEIGEIRLIGEWVLQSACMDAMNWPEHLMVAVNVSPLQFESGAFVESVRVALERSGLPASRLEIEITEGVLIDNAARAREHLEAIRDLGVSIAMDDFGTGYSSLSYLSSFPFSKIKIDQSFVRGEQSDRSRALVDAIITLGQSLGMETLAEGVETADQFDDLARGGCRSAQGYLISKPIANDQIDDFLAASVESIQNRSRTP